MDWLRDLVDTFGVLDWVLIALTVAFAVIGWVQGFVVGLLSLVGLIGGAAIGLIVAPSLLSSLEPGLGTAMLAILLVVLGAALGQWALSWIGETVRERMGGDSARRIDGVAGSVLAAVSVLVVGWLIGAAVASASIPWLSSEARSSTVLAAVDDVMPFSADRLREPLRDVVDSGGFPEVVAPFVEEVVIAVEEPAPDSERSNGVRAALPGVVKVLGLADQCAAQLEGSGVVMGRASRVLTNAHVVAGTSRVVVQAPGHDPIVASVVFIDPDTDVAVLDAPGLQAPQLTLYEEWPRRGDEAVVVGYPNGGGQDTENARVRSRSTLLGLDIYGLEEVQRQVVAFRGELSPGNSGGPLLSPDGTVIGLIFAASLTDLETGYALAPPELENALAAASAKQVTPVPTGACVR